MILLVALFYLLTCPIANATNVLKGSLLFEENGGFQLNQEFMTFSRKLDTSDLETFAFTLRSSSKLYTHFCDSVLRTEQQTYTSTNPMPHGFIPSPSQVPITRAASQCLGLEADLPEVKTVQDERTLEDLMKKFNIKQTPAGVEYSPTVKEFQFNTDKAPVSYQKVFPVAYYGGSYTGAWHQAQWTDSYLTNEAKTFPMMYFLSKEGLRMRIADANDLTLRTTVICQKKKIASGDVVQNNVLIQMAAHSCKRDLPAIQLTTQEATNEINIITNLNIDFNKVLEDTKLDNFLPQITRQKRDLGSSGALSIFGTMLGGTAYIVKSITDSIFGSQYAKKADVIKIAHQIDSIRINQQELRNIQEKLSNTIANLERRVNGIVEGVTILNMETEVKSLNRHLQLVLSTTLLKYSQALMAAKDGKPHPYILPQDELHKLTAKVFDMHKVHLDSNINNVITRTLIHNNSLTFLFDIPIIQQDKLFNFYTIIPLPSFSNGITYLPDIDATNIAISKNGDKYTTLSQPEMQKCLAIPPVCNSHIPTTPMTKQSLCVISSYVTNTRTCELKATSTKPQPFLYFKDTKLFYSVPQNTTIYVKCQKSSHLTDYSEQVITLAGIGEATYKPSCSINLPDGTSFKTPSDKVIHVVNEGPIFRINQALPHNVKTAIVVENITKPDVQFEDFRADDSTFAQVLEEVSTKDIILHSMSMLLPIIIIVAGALCLWPFCKKQHEKYLTKRENKAFFQSNPPNLWFEDPQDTEIVEITPKFKPAN